MAIQESNITLDGLVHTLDDRDRVAAQLVNENANTFTGVNTFTGGILNKNVTAPVAPNVPIPDILPDT